MRMAGNVVKNFQIIFPGNHRTVVVPSVLLSLILFGSPLLPLISFLTNAVQWLKSFVFYNLFAAMVMYDM